jgi:hypothetical protein
MNYRHPIVEPLANSDNRETNFSGACLPYYYFSQMAYVDTLVLQADALYPDQHSGANF